MHIRTHKLLNIRTELSAVMVILIMTLVSGCSDIHATNNDVSGPDAEWISEVRSAESMSEQEMYERALKEDILIVYTVSTRATKTKEVFEETYPGLCVEIRDLRSPDLIAAVKGNYEAGRSDCDIVICNDNSGDFKSVLVDTGMVVPYIPSDIEDKLKPGHVGDCISFLDEAELICYNSDKYAESPVTNIWELTDERFKGRIYIPNPLRSFSTYAFVASTFAHEDEMVKAYEEYNDLVYDGSSGPVVELFWTKVSDNAVFTNSSDEVAEALNTGDADIGVMVSSKLRFRDMGYTIEPVYKVRPFAGCRTSYSVMLASGSDNIYSAGLFVRCLLGGEDGKGDGYKPFCTVGTWSARTDVADGNDVPLDECDLIIPDQEFLTEHKEATGQFLADCLKDHGTEQGD